MCVIILCSPIYVLLCLTAVVSVCLPSSLECFFHTLCVSDKCTDEEGKICGTFPKWHNFIVSHAKYYSIGFLLSGEPIHNSFLMNHMICKNFHFRSNFCAYFTFFVKLSPLVNPQVNLNNFFNWNGFTYIT